MDCEKWLHSAFVSNGFDQFHSSLPMMRPFQKASGKIDHVTRGAHVDFSKISHVLNERLQILNDNSEKKTSLPVFL